LRAQTQVIFSIDFRGGTIAQPNSQTGTPIHESDLMRPPFVQPTFGPLPPPATQFDGSTLGLSAYTACVSQVPGQPCQIEVDALSFGTDAPFDNTLPAGAMNRARIMFSVDRFATGVPGSGLAPNVFSEGALGTNEAAADIFTVIGTIAGPLGVPPTTGANRGEFDGNGLPNTAGKRYRGLGLREPGQLGPFDDLDALAISTVPSGVNSYIYFSLDGNTVDPLTLQSGTNSAQIAGFSASAILQHSTSPGGSSTVYANPFLLGLSPTMDDLDALLIAENGDGIYQPSINHYQWLTGATDMVLFSVRRGSAIVGMLDTEFGIPIEPGDILAPPMTPGARPRIFIAAERLGLKTNRGGGAMAQRDELDALGSVREPYLDCNMNGRDDAEDITVGYSVDTNGNNIPDECEKNYTRYCFCEAPKGPCGNHEPAAGCLNSAATGGLLSGARTASVATDDLEIAATQLTPFSIGLLFMGPTQLDIPFGDGRLCVGPTVFRLQIAAADVAGTALYGPGFVAMSNSIGGAAVITAGTTMNFQVWYRDSAAFCTTSTYNLTNGLSVVFSP